MAATQVLEACAARRAGSSPAPGTKFFKNAPSHICIIFSQEGSGPHLRSLNIETVSEASAYIYEDRIG